MVGQTISHYRILEKLGEGGMGVVYKAEDTKLRRTVALKFLPPHALENRERFLREAQAAAALNHPNICTVFEIDEEHGFLAMEYIDGPSLREKIAERPLRLEEAIDIAMQACQGLQAAHEKGIVHRDIKPANLMFTAQGQVKLMDFGLAQVGDRTRITKTGVSVGTPAYMSPEQAQGQPTDRRTDIWSLGVVLYEMVTGRLPFEGEREAAVVNSIIREPYEPITARRAGVPLELERIVGKALAKNPAERYQHLDDMHADLLALRGYLSSARASAVHAQAGPLSQRRRLWAIAALVLFIATAALWLAWRKNAAEPLNNPLVDARFTRLTDVEGTEVDAAISPDGNFVAFLSDRNGQFDVWLSRVGAGSPINLTPGKEDERGPLRSMGFSWDGSEIWLRGTDNEPVRLLPLVGGTPRVFLGGRAVAPAWSPDGARLAYHTLDAGDPIYVADRNGANPRRIFAGRSADWHNHFLVWSADGRWIYFVHGTPASKVMDLWRISPSGGLPERLTQHNSDLRDPTPLGPKTILYVASEGDGSGPWLWALDIEQKRTRRITHGLEKYTSVAASADGKRWAATVSYPSVGLWSVPILDRTAQESDVKPFSLSTPRALVPRFGGSALYYLSSRGTGDGLWRYRGGETLEIWRGSEGALVEAPAISPDGRRIAILLRKGGKPRLHVISADGGELQAIATDLDAQGSAAWSPDGKWVVAGGNDGTGDGLFKVPVAGGSPVRLTNKIGRNPVWSPDGSLIAYAGPNIFTQTPLLALRPDGSAVELPPIRMHRDGERVRFLPDGRGLIYLHGSGATPWEDFWMLDLETKKTRQLTRLSTPATMRTFDITPDGKQIVFDRLRENSDVVLIDLPR